jgi:hypothetical protein
MKQIGGRFFYWLSNIIHNKKIVSGTELKKKLEAAEKVERLNGHEIKYRMVGEAGYAKIWEPIQNDETCPSD